MCVCARERECIENANAESRVCVCVRVRVSLTGVVRRYPRRIKGLAETRLKNHDARARSCVVEPRIHPSFFFSPLSLLFQLSVRFAALASPSFLLQNLRARPRPKQPGTFCFALPVCDDDILFRTCYANRELSSDGERCQNKRRVFALGRLRKFTVDLVRTVYKSRCDSVQTINMYSISDIIV